MPQYADEPKQYAIPGTGAFIPIPATKFARRVKMWENTLSPSGIIVRYLDQPGVNYVYPPQEQPFTLGDDVTATSRGGGSFIAVPAQDGSNAKAAENYCSVASMGAATTLNVLELS